MPVFVPNEDRFLELAKKAIECRVKKNEKKGIVKLKVRTKRYLYTHIEPIDKAASIIEKLKPICKSIKEL